MRTDDKPRKPLLTSKLPLGTFSRPGESPAILCPRCHTWRHIEEGQLAPHPRNDGTGTCAQSRRRVEFDLTPGQYAAAYDHAMRQAAARRSAPARGVQPPPEPPPLSTWRRPRPRPA